MGSAKLKWVGFPLTKMERLYVALQFEYWYDGGPRVFGISHPRRLWLDAVVNDIRRLGRD